MYYKNKVEKIGNFEYSRTDCHTCNNRKGNLKRTQTRREGVIGLCSLCSGYIVGQDLEAMLRGMQEEAEIKIKVKQRKEAEKISQAYNFCLSIQAITYYFQKEARRKEEKKAKLVEQIKVGLTCLLMFAFFYLMFNLVSPTP